MNKTKLETTALFAAPMASRLLQDAESLNRDLEQLLLAREAAPYKNPHPTHIPQHEVFESDFDLFRWPEPCIQTLRGFILESIGELVMDLNGYSGADMAKLQLHNHTWFHITRHGGSFVAHNHPMASWSAVYCVRSGESVSNRVDSGVLRFLDNRPGANMYIDPGNAKVRMPYNFGHYSMRLAPGQLVIFPSWLMHEVAPFMGNDVRITIASNCWFTTRQ